MAILTIPILCILVGCSVPMHHDSTIRKNIILDFQRNLPDGRADPWEHMHIKVEYNKSTHTYQAWVPLIKDETGYYFTATAGGFKYHLQYSYTGGETWITKYHWFYTNQMQNLDLKNISSPHKYVLLRTSDSTRFIFEFGMRTLPSYPLGACMVEYVNNHFVVKNTNYRGDFNDVR